VALRKMALKELWKIERKLVNALSFTSEIRELCEILNRKLEQIEDGHKERF
jgi:hypothetical protein